MLRSLVPVRFAGAVASILALTLHAGCVLADPEPGRALGSFETEIGCAKAKGLGPQPCRRAFAQAVAEFEAKTKVYANRSACFRAFGPCMPWPLGSRVPRQFRPQWMGVSISVLGADTMAFPIAAPGKIRLAFVSRSLSGTDVDSAGVPAPSGPPNMLISGPARERTKSVCGLIESEARREDLPAAFLTRLLWQESSFRSEAISPAGAQGIAQFMPATAGDRGLDDPFDARKAIGTSASLLRDLRHRFGNLGLAAAAYNGGPARISDWLQGHRSLPEETRNYVLRITGRSVEDWAKAQDRNGIDPSGQSMSCVQAAAEMVGTR